MHEDTSLFQYFSITHVSSSDEKLINEAEQIKQRGVVNGKISSKVNACKCKTRTV